MSLCTGKPHADGKPCRGVQTIPGECFECGTTEHYGFDVNYYPDELPHWQCHRCHGGYWFWTPDGSEWPKGKPPEIVVGWAQVHRGDALVAQFSDESDAEDYINQKNEDPDGTT